MLIASSMESFFPLLVEQLQLFSPPFQLSIQINFSQPFHQCLFHTSDFTFFCTLLYELWHKVHK